MGWLLCVLGFGDLQRHTGVLVFHAIILLPRRGWRQGVVRALAQLALRLAGIPLLIQGQEHLPHAYPYVLVANHASYLNVLILLAVLPAELRYVGKRELRERFISRVPLRRLGVEFVERFVAPQSVEDTTRVLQAVRQGWAMVFFPKAPLGVSPDCGRFTWAPLW
jgi:1-acyl-sn-glycerol-3-phosphate acyltransferase